MQSLHHFSFHFKVLPVSKHISDLNSLQLSERSRPVLFIFLCVKASSEMKTLLFRKSIALVCLLLFDFCSSAAEEFKIFRYRQPSKESFFIPLSKCNNDTVDYCGEFNAAKDIGRGCFCDCDDKHATFSFYKKSWSCLRNEDVRTFFGKFLCIRTFFSLSYPKIFYLQISLNV